MMTLPLLLTWYLTCNTPALGQRENSIGVPVLDKLYGDPTSAAADLAIKPTALQSFTVDLPETISVDSFSMRRSSAAKP